MKSFILRLGPIVILLMGSAVAWAQQQSPLPELTGTIDFHVSSRSGMVQSLVVTVGDGGTGPYKAVLMGDPTLPTHALYRPRDLSPFGERLKLPIVAFANGGCRNSSGEFRNFLSQVASNGFLIVAIGPAASAATLGSEAPTQTTQPKLLTDGINWAIAENSRKDSPYYGKIDTAKIAVMGQSCGGVQALDIATSDPRITTAVILNSGVVAGTPGRNDAAPRTTDTMTKDRLQNLHSPIAYFIGGAGDLAYVIANDDFPRIQKVPVFMANRDVGHYPGTYREPNGGAFAVASGGWLQWQLKGDQTAAKMFTGASCGLCADPKWKVERKLIP
jgi:chlorophyllase-like protein